MKFCIWVFNLEAGTSGCCEIFMTCLPDCVMIWQRDHRPGVVPKHFTFTMCCWIFDSRGRSVLMYIFFIIIIIFMQGIYTYIPETTYVPREYSVAAILLLLFMVLISLLLVFNPLYFYISTFQSMCAVPNMAVFCSSFTYVFLVRCSRIFWMTLK